MTRARVLLADDHRMVAEGLRSLLEPEFELVEIVEDGRQLIEAAERLAPDVIVVDITMPFMNGLDAVEHLRKASCKAKIVILTMHRDVTYVTTALQAGASGFVLKNSASSELLTAMREVMAGRTYITPPAGRTFEADVCRRWFGEPNRSSNLDSSSTRSASTLCRRPLRQAGGCGTPYLAADCGEAQGEYHGNAPSYDDCGTRAICSPSWNHFRLSLCTPFLFCQSRVAEPVAILYGFYIKLIPPSKPVRG